MKKLFIIIFTLTILFSSTGCKKFFDVNRDPDKISDAPIELVLPAALSSPLYILGGDGQIYGAIFAQHWTSAPGGPQYTVFDQWSITNSTFDGRGYGALYFNALADLKYVRDIAEETENWSYYLIVNVVEAYVFQMLADMYDKVPYFEALYQGENPTSTPKFDDGETIYNALIEKLNNALAKDLSASTCKDPGEADIVFQGDMDQWERFAYSLKLKIYLRQSFVNREKVAPEIVALLNDPEAKFLESDADIDFFLDQSNKRNPVYATTVKEQPGNISLSRTLMNLLVDNLMGNQESGDQIIVDPRVYAIANKPDRVQEFFRAILQGDYQNSDTLGGITMNELENPGGLIQYLSTPIIEYNTPSYFMTKAETYFLLAEAKERFVGVGNGKNDYESGVMADYDRLGLPSTRDTVDILDDDDYARWFDAGENATVEEHCRLIWTQKWIAMANIQGMEAWIEHNRTDTPKEYPYHPDDYETYNEWMHASGDPDTYYENGWFTIAVNNVTSNRFPRRFLCPQSEINLNPNVPSDMRSAQIYDKVWWDVEPVY